MQLNEDTYSYIHRVADQIEGLTCALIVFIENAGTYLESYHYEAFNRFSNEIRDMEISVSEEIKNEFLDVKRSIEELTLEIRASDSSVNHLKMQLSETEDIFSRLVIHSQNIREINSDTSNPYVPNASDEVYRAFSGYNTLLDQYQVNIPDENDYICTLMYSFYCTVKGLFEQLFSEYDTMLQEFGVNVEEKKKRLAILTTIKKREGRQDITKASLGLVKTTAFAALGIKKKSDVVDAGIGLIAKISKNLDELDELKFAKPKKSLARKIIKGIAVYNDAKELIDGVCGVGEAINKGRGIDFEVPTLEKLKKAIPTTLENAQDIEEWRKSGKLDVIQAKMKTSESLVKMGSAIVGQNPYAVIKEIPDLGTNVLDLVEKTAKYMVKNDIHVKPKAVDKVLHKLGNELAKYEKEMEQYKIDKEKKMLAVKKPKAPPFIIAKGIFEKLKDGTDFYDDIHKDPLSGSGGGGGGAW